MLPRPNPAVICKSLNEGAVLFSEGDETYYGLNAVGFRVWQALPPQCRTLEELCASVGQAFTGAEPDVIRVDVVELLDELARSGLVLPP